MRILRVYQGVIFSNNCIISPVLGLLVLSDLTDLVLSLDENVEKKI